MTFAPYPETKPSGVEWLGEVPTHWDVKRLKNSIAFARNGIWGEEPKDDENDLVCVRVADFDRNTKKVKPENFTFRNISPSEQIRRTLRKGDLLLEKSGGGELQPVGFVVSFDHEISAVCSNFIARLQCKKSVNNRYFCYVHSAAYSVKLNSRAIKQTTGIQNLDEDAYLNETAPFPPLPEQLQIAAFLDRKTAEIDHIIGLKERQIALIAENRQALISRAVTRGLDPNVPLKASGIEWLGDVPGHWEVKRLKFAAQIISGQSPNESTYNFDGNGAVLINGPAEYSETDFGATVEIKWTTEPIRWAPKNALLFCLRGSTTGRLNITHDKVCIGRGVAALIANDEQGFLNYVMLTMRPLVIGTCNGSTFPSVTSENLGDYWMGIPPKSEQQAIVSYLDSETARMDGVARAVEAQIGKLKEWRQALISAAVTGKIDVRGEMAGQGKRGA